MAINKGPGNGQQIVSIMQGYNTNTNVTTDNHNSIILGSGNVVGDRVNALVVGDNLTVENDGIATTNLTVTETVNGRAVSDILPTYTKYVALITQISTNDPTVVELENTIGPIIWTRQQQGNYVGTLTGAFTVNKTTTMINQLAFDAIVRIYNFNVNSIVIEVDNIGNTPSPEDGNLNNNTIEIRIYP